MGFHSLRLRALIGTGGQQVEINANALLLGVLNTPSYGAGLRLAPDAQTDDGRLDLVLLEDLSFLESPRANSVSGSSRRTANRARPAFFAWTVCV